MSRNEIMLTLSQKDLMFTGDMYYFDGNKLIYIGHAMNEKVEKPLWKRLLIKWLKL